MTVFRVPTGPAKVLKMKKMAVGPESPDFSSVWY